MPSPLTKYDCPVHEWAPGKWRVTTGGRRRKHRFVYGLAKDCKPCFGVPIHRVYGRWYTLRAKLVMTKTPDTTLMFLGYAAQADAEYAARQALAAARPKAEWRGFRKLRWEAALRDEHPEIPLSKEEGG